MKYSLWLVPPEPLHSDLTQVIHQLAQQYDGPTFEPHITLLGDLEMELAEIEQKANQLAIKIKPLALSYGPISFSTTHFQSVFVRVNSTAALMQANLDAKEIFGVENNVFMPHTSLLYGHHDKETREKACQGVTVSTQPFVIENLVVVPAVPDPQDWEHVITVPLK